MRGHIGLALALTVALVSPLFGQLHLITGNPNPKEPPPGGYESAVFRLRDDGSLARAATIVPAAVGSEWIVESQSLRKMVIGQRYPEPIVVFDFDRLGIVKRCEEPDADSWGELGRWLVDLPARGPALAMDRAYGRSSQIIGMVLDPSVSCDKSFAVMDPGEMGQVLVSGVAGVAEIGGKDVMSTILNRKTGKLEIFFPQGSGYLDQDLPMEMFAGMDLPWTHILVNNSDIMALSITDYGKSGEQRLVVFRKRDKTWLRVPKLSEKFAVRGFGAFLAITAAQVKDARLPESAGRAEWRTERTEKGPDVAWSMERFPIAYPGRLHLYDATNERVRTITTNQGDSEVLLVEGQTIYYRASDRLYSATFTATGFTDPHLLAKDEAIRDAHWAFIKR